MLIVGFDFDGVVIYNPMHIARAPIALFKRYFLGLKKTSFYKPKNPFQLFIWRLLFFFSFPAKDGLAEIKRLKDQGKINPILLTGRFDLKKLKILKILKRAGFEDLFSEIIVNEKNEQPHEFKARVIREKKMEVYVEDNIDIVIYLNNLKIKNDNPELVEGSPQVTIFWLYNILDRRFNYSPRFPSLKKAVHAIK